MICAKAESAPEFIDAGDEAAVVVDGAGDDGVAGFAGDGEGFAGEHGFIDAARAFDDDAVGGDAVAGADEDVVADVEGGDGDFFGKVAGCWLLVAGKRLFVWIISEFQARWRGRG